MPKISESFDPRFVEWRRVTDPHCTEFKIDFEVQPPRLRSDERAVGHAAAIRRGTRSLSATQACRLDADIGA